AQPVDGRYAPAVPRLEPREPVLGDRRAQVVADALLVLEELLAHDRADRVAAEITGARAAAPVAVETGQRIVAALLERPAEHVAFRHCASIAHPRKTPPDRPGDTSPVAEDLGFAQDETLEERAFDYSRTVALSDGVFAIALTLLVLNITVPSLGPSQHSQLGRRLLDHRDEFASYAISFAVISIFW